MSLVGNFNVVPAYKNDGERSDPETIISSAFFLLWVKYPESFVNNRINKYLESTGLFSDLQYGFRAFRSTADLLTVLSKHIYNSLEVGGETRAIALDILKAFDKVWRAGLLHKLKAYSVRGCNTIPPLNLFFKIGLLRLLLMASPVNRMTSMQEYCRDWFWDPLDFWCISMTILMMPFQEFMQ